MCEEYKNAYDSIMKKLTNEDDREFLKNTTKYIKNKQYRYYYEHYRWKSHGDIHFYRNYDSIYDGLQKGDHGFSEKIGKRKLKPAIYIYGLPDYCFSKNRNNNNS
jgi:hypothetical protein